MKNRNKKAPTSLQTAGLTNSTASNQNIPPKKSKSKRRKSTHLYVQGLRCSKVWVCNVSGELAQVLNDIRKPYGTCTRSSRIKKLRYGVQALRKQHGLRIMAKKRRLNGKNYTQYWLLDKITHIVEVRHESST